MDLEPVAIDFDSGVVIMSDDSVLPITNWFDEDGDECEADDAVSLVCGTGGVWVTISLAEFAGEPETMH